MTPLPDDPHELAQLLRAAADQLDAASEPQIKRKRRAPVREARKLAVQPTDIQRAKARRALGGRLPE